jgi:hypothetical protein
MEPHVLVMRAACAFDSRRLHVRHRTMPVLPQWHRAASYRPPENSKAWATSHAAPCKVPRGLCCVVPSRTIRWHRQLTALTWLRLPPS